MKAEMSIYQFEKKHSELHHLPLLSMDLSAECKHLSVGGLTTKETEE